MSDAGSSRANDPARSAKILEQLEQRERLEATVRLAGSVAHDMNNILGAVMGIAELLKAEVPDGHPWSEDLGSILDVSLRGRTLVRELVERVREHKLQKNRVRLDKAVRQVAGLLKRVIPANVRLELDAPPETLPEVNGDPVQLGQTLMNLCQNAVEAMRDDGGTLALAVEHVPPGPDDPARDSLGVVRLTIRDTGSGMDEATLARAFQPYFTTKSKSEESMTRTDKVRVRGLGLTTAHKTVNSHGGRISLESELGVGTTVTIDLPAIGGPVTA